MRRCGEVIRTITAVWAGPPVWQSREPTTGLYLRDPRMLCRYLRGADQESQLVDIVPDNMARGVANSRLPVW